MSGAYTVTLPKPFTGTKLGVKFFEGVGRTNNAFAATLLQMAGHKVEGLPPGDEQKKGKKDG